jgi:hypothetical protein
MRKLEELNGCGGKGESFDPPDWLFTASCEHHDFNYWLGGDEEARKKADLQFYKAMLIDASRAPWWKRPWYKLMAWIYYRAVRYYASDFFNHGPEKTLEDLQTLVVTAEV